MHVSNDASERMRSNNIFTSIECADEGGGTVILFVCARNLFGDPVIFSVTFIVCPHEHEIVFERGDFFRMPPI